MIVFILEKRNIFLGALALLTAVVASRAAAGLDIALIRAAQSFPTDVFDYFSLFFTVLGSGEVTGVITAAVAAWLFARGHRKAAFYLLLFFGLSVAVELAMKFSVPQPKVFPEFRRGLKLPVPVYSPFTPFAYPSGHATRSVILTIVFIYVARLKIAGGRAKRSAAAALGVLCVLMLFSRVYEGSHWPLDVLGGVCLGSYLAAHIIRQFQKDNF